MTGSTHRGRGSRKRRRSKRCLSKKLEYPVRIRNANPALAKFICSQYGGPDGELGASLRYLSQRYAMPYPELSALLTDIGTEAAEMALQIEA